MTRLQLRIVCCIVLVPAMLVLNYGVVEPALIPDPCEERVPAGLTIFYTINSSTGFHPEPNLLNFVVTLGVGVLIAYVTSTFIARRLKSN